jgi:fumarylacetoacetase
MLNETHNPDARSWVASANRPDTDFPIQNLPFGVFVPRSARDGGEAARVGVAIGDRVLDIAACHRRDLFRGLAADAAEACASSSLNTLLALGRPAWSALRARAGELLRADRLDQIEHQRLVGPWLHPIADVTLLRPIDIGNYTDFYASIHHATNMGRMFRPDSPLLPNYKYVPIGYHGRASSIVVSGTAVRRPSGQVKPEDGPPVFTPTARLDYELELGLVIGSGNAQGTPIAIDAAEDHLFGVCLVNDWSARDVQAWEYQPLGPFLAKNFATSISPWIVTMEALEPFRVAGAMRDEGEPEPLPYLSSEETRRRGGIDLTLEVWLQSARMREQDVAPVRISASRTADLYWTAAQLVTHHASNGCNLCPGDLLASGTVSGPEPSNRGCLQELTWRGTEPIALPTGETRRFLEEGDEVVFRGYAQREGATRIGLGECRGIVIGG